MPEAIIPDTYIDWTDPRWDHRPSPRGIPYPVGMSSSQAAKILDKAGKKQVIGGRNAKGKSTTNVKHGGVKK